MWCIDNLQNINTVRAEYFIAKLGQSKYLYIFRKLKTSDNSIVMVTFLVKKGLNLSINLWIMKQLMAIFNSILPTGNNYWEAKWYFIFPFETHYATET